MNEDAERENAEDEQRLDAPPPPPQADRADWKRGLPWPLALLSLWCGLQAPVSRNAYFASGLGLALFKYVVEASVVFALLGVWFTPLDYLNPLISGRARVLTDVPVWLPTLWFAWTLPFFWIGASMSVRRAADAGLSPWYGLTLLVPFVNFTTMALLSILPTRAAVDLDRGKGIDPKKPPATTGRVVGLAALGSACGALAGLAVLGLSVYGLGVYGSALFVGSPLLMGTVASVIYNADGPRGWGESVLVGMAATIVAGAALMCLALEGAICIAMAAPLAVPLGALGGLIGKAIATMSIRPIGSGATFLVVVMPAWVGIEALSTPEPTFLVATSVEIDAPPATVWRNVVDFPDLEAPDEWYYRYGIACPMRAEMHGEGVGAVRHCIFTTGTFVEPITAWDEPRRLAFDVRSQPKPMFELSPYRDLHPPHLDGAMESVRGEFLLVELPGGRTRLTGRTWYRLEMTPHDYWTIWSDLIVHRIHRRVLNHVKEHAEAEAAGDSIESYVSSNR